MLSKMPKRVNIGFQCGECNKYTGNRWVTLGNSGEARKELALICSRCNREYLVVVTASDNKSGRVVPVAKVYIS